MAKKMLAPTFLFLSVPEAATALNCTDAYVRQLLIDGRIKGQKLGQKNWAIPAGEIERFKKDRKPRGRPPQ